MVFLVQPPKSYSRLNHPFRGHVGPHLPPPFGPLLGGKNGPAPRVVLQVTGLFPYGPAQVLNETASVEHLPLGNPARCLEKLHRDLSGQHFFLHIPLPYLDPADSGR